jgi:hypothetical protein
MRLCALLAALLTLAACTTTTTGNGTAGQTATPTRSSSSAPSRSPSPTVTRTSRSAGSPGTTLSTSGSSSVSVQLLGVSYVVSCTSHADTAGTVKLSWTSKGATEVYLLEGPVAGALVGANAKSGKGPFPPNGSSVQPFRCAENYDYFLVEAYNGGSRSGIVQQVPFS